MTFFAFIKSIFTKKKRVIKLGLALGSGGAKGFAEIGALKAFEENGIEFDIIAGTSIGSIVGAGYANGLSADDILDSIKKIDINEIKNFFMIGMDTSGLKGVLDRTFNSINIEDLKKPFKTVATEVDTGDIKVFDKGNLALALCASSAFTPFFKPVLIDGVRYVDGAYCNSIPADLVKQMGADYIVGIDLKNHEAKPSLLSRIIPTYQGKVEKPWQVGYDNANIMLKPDLAEYSSTSFSDMEIMYKIGYKTAMDNMEKIKQDIALLKNPKKK